MENMIKREVTMAPGGRKDEVLNAGALAQPSPEFSPAYFWSLNDALDERVLIAQLRDMHARGLRSVCIHPMPPEFCPETMANAMSPPYLSDEYFRLIRRIVDECAALGMHFYLYDEAAWPSGSAAGRVYARNPRGFSRKCVGFDEIKLESGKNYRVDPDALSGALRNTAGIAQILPPGAEVAAAGPDMTLRVFKVREGRAYLPPRADPLCLAATRTFIKLTHENYARHLGERLGANIKFAFTDEPAAEGTHPAPASVPGRLTWTADLPQVFLREKGYDLIPHLPRFFEKNRDIDTTRVLLDFYDVWSKLFAARYLHPLRDWCREHGLLSGGHMGGEDELRYNADGGFGHILRALRELDLPGIDAIWRQIFPGNPVPPVFPKYAQSVARQKNGPGLVLSESFMVYGNGLTPAEMKWIVDQQLALGVNVFVFGHYAYATRDHFMAFARPFFGPVNPFWKYLAPLHEYVTRLGYLLSRGRSACATAVYCPIRDVWSGGEDRARAIAMHGQVSARLLEHQCDFDFVDDDLLIPENLGNGCLIAGPASYSTIIVTKSAWLTESALKCLAGFVENGGRLIAVGGMPAADGGRITLAQLMGAASGGPDAHPGPGQILAADIDKLSQAVEPLVKIHPPQPGLRVCKRVCANARIYFLANAEDREVTGEFRFPENASAWLYDAADNSFERLDCPNGKPGNLRLLFAPWASRVVVFADNPDEFHPVAGGVPGAAEEILNLNEGWRIRPLRRYAVGEKNFEISNLPDESFVPAKLGDWRGQLGGDFSGDAEYRVEFDLRAEKSGQYFLDLGQVRYAASVELNGIAVGAVIWKPFVVDVTGAVRTGRNALSLTVTNSLANAILREGLREQWLERCGREWPAIKFPYDERQRAFEKDSLPSGLSGPVRLLGVDA